MNTKMKFFLLPFILVGIVMSLMTSCIEEEELDNLTGVMVTESVNGGLLVSWDPIIEALSYSVYVAESAEGPFDFVKKIDDDESYYEYLEGTPGETYYFRVRWFNGSQFSSDEDAEIVSAAYPISLLSELSLEVSTDLPSDYRFSGKLEWTVNPNSVDYSKITAYKIAVKYEGMDEYLGWNYKYSNDFDSWPIFWEDFNLDRTGNVFSKSVGLFTAYNDADGQEWQADTRTIMYKIVAVDENYSEISSIIGSQKLQLFDEVREVDIEADGDDLDITFIGSSLATHYQIELIAKEGTFTFTSSGSNKLVLSKSELNKIDWVGPNGPKSTNVYQFRLNNVSKSQIQSITVTPGKSSNDAFDEGSDTYYTSSSW